MQQVAGNVFQTAANLNDVASVATSMAVYVGGLAPSASSIPTIPASMLDSLRSANTTGVQSFAQVKAALLTVVVNIQTAQTTVAAGLNGTISGLATSLTSTLGGMLQSVSGMLGTVSSTLTPMKSIVDMAMSYRYCRSLRVSEC